MRFKAIMEQNNQDNTNPKSAKEIELEGQLKRALADYANLQKRLEKEKSEMVKFSNELLLMRLISVLDGLEMTVREFRNLLVQSGFERIEVEAGSEFNAQTMEAIDKSEEGGKVVEVYAPAYKLHDKIVRPAQVKLGNEIPNFKP